MPTTVNPTFQTAYQIICDAMFDVGKLQVLQTPSGEDLANNMRRLNKLINFYQTQGLKLWLIEDLSIPLVAGQALYTLGPTGNVVIPKPMRVISGYYLDQFNNHQPLIPLSWDEYTRLSNLTQQGALNSYFVDKQILTLNVYFWLTPNSTAAMGMGHCVIEQQVTNAVNITDSTMFPIEWALLLEWGLADQISTGQPQSVQTRAFAMAGIYREALENWDVEDASTQLTPDPRNQQYVGRFR
jgi:hypothetical protein